jgi:hypothetical protein
VLIHQTYIVTSQTKSTTPIVKKVNELYFGCKVGGQDKSWAPHSYCSRCSRYLDGHNSKSEHTIVYPSVPSALRPVEHDDSLPIPKPPQQQTQQEEPTSTSSVDELELHVPMWILISQN